MATVVTVAVTMQNFDDLDIEGRNPSHLSEEEKEKVRVKGISLL